MQKNKSIRGCFVSEVKRLLNPRVTVRPPQTVMTGFSEKWVSCTPWGSSLSIKTIFQTAIIIQVLLSPGGVSLNHQLQQRLSHFFPDKQDFKQRHKTNPWIWNSANQALLNKISLVGIQWEALLLFERSRSIQMLWMQVKAAALRAPGLMEAQPEHCCSAGTLQPQRGSDLCHCFLVM